MKELEEILQFRRDIESIDERLAELILLTQPKAQTISDMPRGGQSKNSIEEYVIKSEKLQKKRDHFQKLIDARWSQLEKRFKTARISGEQKVMLRLRFYRGLPWKVCRQRLQKKFPEQGWSESKLFRLYRAAVGKLYKSQL